jgi:hypothetical protein
MEEIDAMLKAHGLEIKQISPAQETIALPVEKVISESGRVSEEFKRD